jgi:hypothetical protein
MILDGWFCPKCKSFNGEEKEFLSRCRSCDGSKPERISTKLAIILANSIKAGKPVSGFPNSIAFSYTRISMLLARYVLEQTENRNWKVEELSPGTASEGSHPRAEQVTESPGG